MLSGAIVRMARVARRVGGSVAAGQGGIRGVEMVLATEALTEALSKACVDLLPR